MHVEENERRARAARGRAQEQRLAALDVAGVALTWVDNAGICRVKAVPTAMLAAAAAWGVGASPVFDVFLADDSATSGRHAGGPVGDLRLVPDLDRLVPLAAQPGWAWAPVDRWTQHGTRHPQCSRAVAARMVDALAAEGLSARAGFEVEWVVAHASDRRGGATGHEVMPAGAGPAYGMARLVELSDYTADLLRALAAQGVAVAQLHPEYAAGQLEISTVPESPVAAADTAVLVRTTIRAVAARHGLRVSFAPVVVARTVGNGGHVHLSVSHGERNLLASGNGPYGLSADGEAFAAGILARLPALLAVGAPSVASYLRLVPSHWAGVFACWGLENREAALRLVTGSPGERDRVANVEVKCVDQTANPYLLVAALLACGLAGIAEGARLPEPVEADPASWSDAERAARGVARLPQRLSDALAAFSAEPVLARAFDPELHDTIAAVRRAEIDRCAGLSPEEIVAASRWTH